MWQLKIEDPSGETRILPMQTQFAVGAPGFMTMGKDESCALPLRDPVAPREAAVLWPKAQGPEVKAVLSPFWIRVPEGAPSCLLGDLSVREAQLPAGLPFRIGETRLTVESSETKMALPTQPASIRNWLTRSESGSNLLWMAKKAAATPLSLYLAGETGTGKEVLAHLLHAWSDRANGPFVPLHCGALALSLAESELFGHVKGAFTGAIHQRPGALMQAHNGTLFLDEAGDLPMDIQVKLLRFLENGEIRPVGADRSSRADVRILCATHHPLEKLVQEGKFRQDLYYRLASVTLMIPPLRSRPRDVEFLAQKFCSEFGRSLSPRAMLRLKAHSWPGNVRELRHAIERACGLAGPFSPVLAEDAFDFLLTSENITRAPSLELGSAVLSLQEMERLLILKVLKLTHGNRGAAAKILGVARSTLFEMLKRHKIMGPKQHEPAWDA